MTYNKKSIEDVEIKAGQKVFVRCDFNVPMKDGVITSDKRIVGALPTIKYLMGKGAKVILASHMGKPHSIFTPNFKLDKKEQAKVQASSYANASKMVVLIDEDKVERMAEDENYRKQYEAIIANAASGISQLKSSLQSSGANVKGFGMQVNDGGTATYFAVLEESSAAQRERIEKKAAEKKAEKKAAEKKAEKKHQKEKLEEARSEKTEKTDVSDKTDTDSGTVTITASSVEELLQKIQDYMQLAKSDTVLTEAEKKVGQNIDFCG